jgi:DNA-directed RNA polymerase specialized sigma24 family protein
MSAPIKIDDEFRRHLLPLDTHEILFLEESIVAEGCREPLVVWQEQGILIDGHNRYEICTRMGLPFQTREKSLPDREAVLDWMDKNQAGRRNMTAKDLEIVRGRIYNRRKKRHGERGPEKSGQPDHSFPKTAEAVAVELDTSERTVRRSGQRAEVYDAMLELDDVDAAKAARSATQKEITEAIKLPPKKAAEELKNKAKEKAEPREGVRKKVPASKPVEDEPATDEAKQGVGIRRAHDAIACLKRIPKNDAFRKRAFEIVSDYIKQNR